MFIVLWGGVYFTNIAGNHEEFNTRTNILALTESISKSIDSDKFKILAQNPTDVNSIEYQSIRGEMLGIGESTQNIGIRWIYTTVLKDGNIEFSVDSIPNVSPDYSPPGDVYTDASPSFIKGFYNAWKSGVSSITDPYTDQWGNFITTIVPIIDKTTGTTIGVMSSDINYQTFYLDKINDAKKRPISATLFFELLILIIFIYSNFLIKRGDELLSKNILLEETERKNLEASNYLNNIINSIADPIFVKDDKLRFVIANDALCEMLGIPREKILGFTLNENLPKYQTDHFTEIDNIVLSTGEENISEEVLTGKDNKILEIVTKKTRYVDSIGNKFIVGDIRDVTENKKLSASVIEEKEALLKLMTDWSKTKESLKTGELRTNTIITSMGEGLIIIDKNYTVVFVNPKALEIMAYEERDVIGQNLHSILKIIKNKTELPDKNWPMEKSFISGDMVNTSIEDDFSIITNKQKSNIAVTFSISPLKSEATASDDNANLLIVIRNANKDRELDRVKSGFISVASHQLRTPLTSVRWYAEVLLSQKYGVLDKLQLDLVKEIHEGTDRLSKIINMLLGISRIESGKTGKNKIPTDISLATRNIIKELSNLMEQRKVTFSSKSLESPSITVMLDPLLLKQVITNLFENAIHYSNDKGNIEVEWQTDSENNILYSVKDNGIGIPLSAQDKIFSKFFRADNAVLKIPDGTGLGLAFVKDVVISWGGTVWFESKEGKGTIFYFTIPTTNK